MQTRRDLFRQICAAVAAPASVALASAGTDKHDFIPTTPLETSGIAIHRRGRAEAGPIWLARSTDAQMLANTFAGDLARALGREPHVYDAMSLGLAPSAAREAPLGLVWECFAGWSRNARGAVHVHSCTYLMESYRWVSLDMLANAAEEMARLLAPARRFYRLGLPGGVPGGLAANSWDGAVRCVEAFDIGRDALRVRFDCLVSY
jgi:hypothetical protein